ncbi:MAG: SH3 domain-containing protein [Elusimicrobia bacterium]|nr:MAG: SH3 domain-containing protein [Elusimicrobiota bacterium]
MRINILALCLIAAVTAWAASGRVTVSVESAKVRKGKAFFSAPVATVKYRDTLAAGSPEDGWIPVDVRGKKGWLHESAVGSKAGKLKGGWDGDDEAGQDEVTLAGKGFNAEVEKAYRSGDAGDYDAVDAMEAREVSEASLLAFMRSGRTLPKEAR